jgi:hypothetical protein
VELRDFFGDQAAWMFSAAVIGSVMSCVVVTIGWMEWLHSRVNGPSDRPFVIGHIAATVSCFSLMSSYLFTTLFVSFSGRARWERGSLVSLFLSGIGGLCFLGVFILPFGRTRIKWLSLVAYALNVVPLLSLDFFYPGT